jgi:8-hydroxy-5-deazaflavin:NADPH oxidoreductase
MNVTIVGTGSMARGIGARAVAGGSSVTVMGRNLNASEELAAEWVASATKGASIQVAPWGSPIDDEVIVLAVHYPVAVEIVQQYPALSAGKILVDISNPMNASFDGLATAADTSAAEEIARLAPAGTRVVKAFNTTFAGTLLAGEVSGHPLDVFIAGDDADAKQMVASLAEAGGLRAIDVGPLRRARQLEGLALLGITLQFTLDTQFMSGWKLVA